MKNDLTVVITIPTDDDVEATILDIFGGANSIDECGRLTIFYYPENSARILDQIDKLGRTVMAANYPDHLIKVFCGSSDSEIPAFCVFFHKQDNVATENVFFTTATCEPVIYVTRSSKKDAAERKKAAEFYKYEDKLIAYGNLAPKKPIAPCEDVSDPNE